MSAAVGGAMVVFVVEVLERGLEDREELALFRF